MFTMGFGYIAENASRVQVMFGHCWELGVKGIVIEDTEHICCLDVQSVGMNMFGNNDFLGLILLICEIIYCINS